MTARIVFVEDSGEEVFLAQCFLTRAGIPSEGRLVRDQVSQQRVLRDWLPHLIVADFTLAQFDGWTAYVTARTFAPSVPFIFRSRNITKRRARQAQERGVLACVHKDEFEGFVSLVRDAMRFDYSDGAGAGAFTRGEDGLARSTRLRPLLV